MFQPDQQDASSCIALGDFNKDGHPDLALCNGGVTFNRVGVMYGRPDGGFSAPMNRAVTRATEAVALDLDGDGASDLVTSDTQGVSGLVVFPGLPDGGLGSPVTYADNCAWTLGAGDFNNDGRPDLFSSNGGCNQLLVFTNQGDGGLPAPLISADSAQAFSVAVADLNGDGNLDLALPTSQSNSGALLILLGDGTGKFTSAGITSTPNSTLGIAAGDFDRDGKVDLVMSQVSGVMLLHALGGNRYQVAGSWPVGLGGSVMRLAAADLNGDGLIDVAASTSGPDGSSSIKSTISVLLGEPDGGFAPALDFVSGKGPSDIMIADFNGDGRPDLAAADWLEGHMTLLLSTGCPLVPGAPTESTSGSTGSSAGSTGGTTGSSGADCTCQFTQAPFNNGNLGASCTGASDDGGFVEGSCLSGEVCIHQHGPGTPSNCYVLDPGCTVNTSPCGPLPASTGAGSVEVSSPSCVPDAQDCPGGLVCEPFTPLTSGSGVCRPPCVSDADCPGFSCVQGVCKCQTDQQCQGDAPFLTCDPVSGACYTGCNNCGSNGCCSEAHGVSFCDYWPVFPDAQYPAPAACP